MPSGIDDELLNSPVVQPPVALPVDADATAASFHLHTSAFGDCLSADADTTAAIDVIMDDDDDDDDDENVPTMMAAHTSALHPAMSGTTSLLNSSLRTEEMARTTTTAMMPMSSAPSGHISPLPDACTTPRHHTPAKEELLLPSAEDRHGRMPPPPDVLCSPQTDEALEAMDEGGDLPPNHADLNTSAVVIDLTSCHTASERGTPVRQTKTAVSSDYAHEWATSRHTVLEQLRAELESGSTTPLRGATQTVASTPPHDAASSLIMSGEGREMEELGGTTRPNISSICHTSHNSTADGGSFVEESRRSTTMTSAIEALRLVQLRHQQHSSMQQSSVRDANASHLSQKQPSLHTSSTDTSQEHSRLSSSRLSGPVFHRLYPTHLAETAERKREDADQAASQKWAKEELSLLRRRCHAISTSSSFDGFMANLLGRPYAITADAATDLIHSSTYISPIAQRYAQKQARAARVSLTRSAKEEMEQSFDDFLHRQHAHVSARTRHSELVEQSITPTFAPQVSSTSTELLRRMIQRRSAESGVPTTTAPSPSGGEGGSGTRSGSTEASVARRRQQHLPISDLLVRKRVPAPCPDCTFSPNTSSSSGNRGAVSIKRRDDLHAALYKEHGRMERARCSAQEKAAKEELQSYPFRPRINTMPGSSNNATAAKTSRTRFDPNNFAQSEAFLRKKEERRARLREELEAQRAKEEAEHCTFKPTTSKTPAYISRMAASFGVARQQEEELIHGKH